ncbi:alpha/beta-hydrolase [Aureobasidium pullulans]|uniref:Alpha/beta-hydrolase n=1 Tax=Aureobasidium pullulans TaxID=5580 RepID=A0A4S8TG02_AURPU|nr:alpha/beta-hydrolase [Aureobasidium pullulans]THW67689.1 alpha/beta-hydrolase [Aureobasidium pullulans]THX06529.1 alpha/beta-hydrolase [Aureobasidium pullulans]THY20928.1 alpha/beta-hydrolase [Aureobasidium pullulans]THZ31817.1 alpha/beta-hydrolase [Aureobasidium pullulans]
MPHVSSHVHDTKLNAAGDSTHSTSKAEPAIEFAHQSERLAQYTPDQERKRNSDSTQAVEAKFVTAQDPVIVTANGSRLPAVPIDEALKLNRLKDRLEDRQTDGRIPVKYSTRQARDGTTHGILESESGCQSSEPSAPLREAVPPSRTNPMFPPLPTYGPPSFLRTLHCCFFRTTSSVLSFLFLLIIVLGAAFTSIPLAFEHVRLRLQFKNPDKRRPFFAEEQRRKKARADANRDWARVKPPTSPAELETSPPQDGEFVPTEGGPDPLVCDVRYYARRVGLDVEMFDVETEDGFIIELWHVYNPREYRQPSPAAHGPHGPDIFTTTPSDPEFGEAERAFPPGSKKYPILMIHGLLQSAGAYCCTDDDSLAFYLAKSGYDVWLGNNRCGFNPRHTLLEYADPRMWSWNIRQMGVLDLPALISRVLAETGFPKLGLVCHSQGTTQTLVALAKEQRPDIGEKISVFCALAPAAYAGPLIGKAYFKFMRVINPNFFRCIFGIHAFIPFMMRMHTILPAKFYGAMGYRVFAFLFNWTDTRWEMDLRDRMFQFAPVYVSAESMRWWLGRECFAKQKCILATREEGRMEDEEDEEEDEVIRRYYDGEHTETEKSPDRSGEERPTRDQLGLPHQDRDKSEERGKYAWYNEQFPPLAMWVAGNDDLVDGRRLLRRFDRGREPHVNVVHKKIIEGYEHLDVIWAMDVIEKVGKEVKDVIWATASEEARRQCRTPIGCEEQISHDQEKANGDLADSFHDERSPREMGVDVSKANTETRNHGPVSPTQVDTTAGEWSNDLKHDRREAKTNSQE